MIPAFVYWIPAVTYAIVIFSLSHQSDPAGADLLPDYVAHFGEYAGLALTLVCGKTTGFRRCLSLPGAFLLWVLAVLFALSDEFHQWFVPNRQPSALDLAADGLGAAFAITLMFVANRGKWRSG